MYRLLVVVCRCYRLLFVVYCLLLACCLLFVGRWLLVGWLVCVVCCLMVVCKSLFIGGCLLFEDGCCFFVVCCLFLLCVVRCVLLR